MYNNIKYLIFFHLMMVTCRHPNVMLSYPCCLFKIAGLNNETFNVSLFKPANNFLPWACYTVGQIWDKVWHDMQPVWLDKKEFQLLNEDYATSVWILVGLVCSHLTWNVSCKWHETLALNENKSKCITDIILNVYLHICLS